MIGRSTWWRRLSGLLAACLLVVLASAPSIDAIVCQDEASIQSAELAKDDLANAETASSSALHGGDVGEVCPHGHCHHVNVYAAGDAFGPGITPFLDTHHGDGEQRVPLSRPGSTPERPPRV